MLLGATETHGKLPGLKVQRWALHAVGDPMKLPVNEGKLAAGKYEALYVPGLSKSWVKKLINMHIHHPVLHPSHRIYHED